MFDLIEGKVDRPLRHQSPMVAFVSVLGHIVAVTILIGVPLLLATSQLPEVPTIMAFVASDAPVASPPPPPPPPAPAAERQALSPKTPPVTASATAMAAPIEAPTEIRPEPPAPAPAGVLGGVPGGIEGGVAGGIVGGLTGAVVMAPPPPPPPPPTPPPAGPVRIGGQLTAPALLSRTEPDYPDIAVAAKVQGIVILEANVDTQGRVTGVKVLRSIHFLDNAAIDAVKEWKYAPLTLNGVPTPFVITVTVNFSLGHHT